MKIADPLVTADWLKSHLSAPDVRVLDATWVLPWTQETDKDTGHRLYLEGHIPGAAFFDIDEIADTDCTLPHMIPPAEKFASRVRKLGVGDGNRIIIYDRGNFMASARVWWMFRLMGHSDVSVLDGGWNAWLAAGGAVEDLPPVTQERHFTCRVQNHLLKNYTQVSEGISSKSITLLDARPAPRFEGRENEPRPGISSGHMPGSVNIPATSLIASDGILKSAEQLENILGDISKKSQLVATCGSGVSAAVILLALQRIGRDDVALYDGSWAEYASMPDAEIRTV